MTDPLLERLRELDRLPTDELDLLDCEDDLECTLKNEKKILELRAALPEIITLLEDCQDAFEQACFDCTRNDLLVRLTGGTKEEA